MTEEETDYQARVATAREFNLPLWIVDMNHICLEKDVEWFQFYSQGCSSLRPRGLRGYP